jgi:hypothetical protein
MPPQGFIKIHHPDRNDTEPPTFVAYGKYNHQRVRNLRGALLQNGQEVSQGTVLGTQNDPTKKHWFWAIFFGGVVHGDYDLTVSDAADPAEFATIPIHVKGGFHTITYPATNGSVCPTFCAYGACANTVDQQNSKFDGSPGVVLQRCPNWVVQFTANVGGGKVLSMRLDGTDVQSTNITVRTIQGGCPDPAG